ncbi:cytochrome P450 [Roridomyces roridus]|uniref:Cytochrome P450 n=1 Tax=Roridomyces roridus TaxID=1738132 RepID=A0AAD7BJ21_9AGAR|nr:cytochrome P450 [Roridomyces roridus]
MPQLTALAFVAGVIFVCVLVVLRLRRLSPPLPPGPPGLPILGNLFNLPRDRRWITYQAWAKEYGDIMHISTLGRHMIILNSETAVLDLLERRMNIYSDRPRSIMGELVGWSESVTTCSYGTLHREYRKMISGVLAPRKLPDYWAMEEEKVADFLRSTLKEPASASAHVKRLASAILLDMSHGYNVAEKNDPIVALAERYNGEFSSTIVSGTYLVEMIPILRHIPSWTGIRFKKDVLRVRRTMEMFRDDPYEETKIRAMNGTAKPSFITKILEENSNPTPQQELCFKWAAIAVYGAGIDTMIAGIESFFLAMSLYPAVQERAYAELLSVVGSTRLPNFKDREDLPYIAALIQELQRWNPVVPLALPHLLRQDDIYRGYHLPKGSVVFANAWALMHDPARYPEPFEFSPERFVNAPPSPRGRHSRAQAHEVNPDPRRYAFGFGRRACPGQFLADDVLFIVIVSTLAVFRIAPVEKTAERMEYTSGIIRCACSLPSFNTCAMDIDT